MKRVHIVEYDSSFLVGAASTMTINATILRSRLNGLQADKWLLYKVLVWGSVTLETESGGDSAVYRLGKNDISFQLNNFNKSNVSVYGWNDSELYLPYSALGTENVTFYYKQPQNFVGTETVEKIVPQTVNNVSGGFLMYFIQQ